jgi:hypothetical protein
MRAKALRLLAAGGVMAAVMVPTAAMAQDVTSYGGGNNHPGSAGGGPGSSQSGSESSNPSGELPFTGGDVVGLALIGAGAIIGGTALARSGRRASV